MGAYASLLFSKILGCTDVIALSPQYSINRGKVNFETRWEKEARSINYIIDDLPSMVSISAKTYIFYDPNDDDSKHVELIQSNIKFKRLNLIKLLGAGHPVAPALLQCGLMNKYLNSILEDNVNIKKLKTEYDNNYQHTAQYGYVRSEQLYKTKDYENASKYAELAINKSSGPSYSYFRTFGRCQLKMGLYATALKAFKRARDISDNDDISSLIVKTSIFASDGKTIESDFMALFERGHGEKLWKFFVDHHLAIPNKELIFTVALNVVHVDNVGVVARTLGGYYTSKGDLLKAKKYALLALEIAPDNLSYQKFAQKFDV
jgi:tetratricopeptide (TPR) repeat protein